MPPPELARDAPVVDVVHPLKISLGVIFRHEFDFAFFHGFDRAVCQWLYLDEPLLWKAAARQWSCNGRISRRPAYGLLCLPATRVLPDRVGLSPALHTVQAGVDAAVLIDAGLVVHNVDLRQIVAQANLKVVGIVCRRDFYSAAAKLRIGVIIGNDRNFTVTRGRRSILPTRFL